MYTGQPTEVRIMITVCALILTNL